MRSLSRRTWSTHRWDNSPRWRTVGAHHGIGCPSGRAPSAVRFGLPWAVRLLVVLAHRVRPVGVVPVGVAVHGGAGPAGRRGEGALGGDAVART